MDEMLKPLRRYADFQGRSRRKEYWLFVLFQTIVFLVLGALALAGGFPLDGAPVSEPGPLFYLGVGLFALFGLALFIPNLAVQVRRFHDQDKSGWLILLGLIPYIGGIIVFVFMLLEGTRGPNRFGADPKGETADLAGVFE